MSETPPKPQADLRPQIERKLRKLSPRQQALAVAYARGLHAGYRLAFDLLRRQQER